MFKNLLLSAGLIATSLFAQEKKDIEPIYHFVHTKQNDALDVLSQGRTGTCWSFATSSFLESELMRMGKGNINLSEMYIVKNVYKEKANNYVRFHGKTNFGEGSLTHDYLNAAEKYGLVPFEDFHPEIHQDKLHNHAEMVSILKPMVSTFAKSSNLTDNWQDAYSRVLDVYFGSDPKGVDVDGKSLSPKKYKDHLGIVAADYRHFTSYLHHPFKSNFILEVPDNWANGEYENIPINHLTEMCKTALRMGYTISWDADVSNNGFSSQQGLALVPKDDKVKVNDITEPIEEKVITQEMRQEKFDKHIVTDDHLMHITGITEDEEGNTFFIVKNSWGTERGMKGFEGHVIVSEAYFRLNTISVTLHKTALHLRK